MNIAVILAGGTGQRLGRDLPKQFITINGKPLIVYTMEIYQRSNEIDAIEVVCLDGYADHLASLASQYQISKLRWIAPGGSSCQESMLNGIMYLKSKCHDEDILLFAMSTSVFVTEDLIHDSLRVCYEHGSAFACMQCIYNLAESFDGVRSNNIHRKETHRTINLPWTARYGKLFDLYSKAYASGTEMRADSYMPTLWLAYGETLWFSKDNALNKIHITTEEDLEIVTAILERRSSYEISFGNR